MRKLTRCKLLQESVVPVNPRFSLFAVPEQFRKFLQKIQSGRSQGMEFNMDEYGQGYPHFITNNLDYHTLIALFSRLHCQIPDLNINTKMTDDDVYSFKPFNSVFGPNIKHLLLRFRAWKKQLTSKCVFERLILFKLQANREKCWYASCKVKYLGFWITQKGIEVYPEKIASIQSIPPLQNVKQAQSFLQTCSWFRRYMQNFAAISRPLSDLTKKKSPWSWVFPQQTTFETLKKCLTTPPVSKQANGTKPYIIRTDSPTGQLARWALEIQAFNLKVLYVAGKANVVADMLSRPVCDEKESPYEVCNIAISDLPVRCAKDMHEAQLADENLKKIIDKYLPDADSEEAQLVIPSSERDSIMEKRHDDPMAGHYEEEGMLEIDYS
ncbi:Transposon Tf2-9 polyprotein like [Argiope bruennichi]|uniref:RNA-directed DNA polymerase n=1 Tax=Argiope bruennichi TaxID=94029 RepID=A0A8T0FS93_ARGBR|nr:Transposon Tf2-9 polyprotein like [Argiope bruennichi]